MDMDGETVEQMRQLIEGKNFAALNDLLEPYQSRSAYAALKRHVDGKSGCRGAPPKGSGQAVVPPPGEDRVSRPLHIAPKEPVSSPPAARWRTP